MNHLAQIKIVVSFETDLCLELNALLSREHIDNTSTPFEEDASQLTNGHFISSLSAYLALVATIEKPHLAQNNNSKWISCFLVSNLIRSFGINGVIQI